MKSGVQGEAGILNGEILSGKILSGAISQGEISQGESLSGEILGGALSRGEGLSGEGLSDEGLGAGISSEGILGEGRSPALAAHSDQPDQPNQPTRVVGLISGTSADGIDAALVDLRGRETDLQIAVVARQTYPYPEAVRSQILAVCAGEPLSVEALAALDDAIAQAFAQAAIAIQADHAPAALIGSHGQTVFHRPPAHQPEPGESPPRHPRDRGYSVQLGRGSAIAYLTGLPVVSNFRAADLAAGGHGAPLVPRIDAALLGDRTEARCVQNLGGIGNVAYLPPQTGEPGWAQGVLGWDTGPGNVLIDLAVQRFTEGRETYDRDGQWAAQGNPQRDLVDHWLRDPFFAEPPPKSTGRELFGPAYLERCLADADALSESLGRPISQADRLATLVEFTVESVAQSYARFLPTSPDRVLLCGGGSRNPYLGQQMQRRLAPIPVETTEALGVDADAKEAIAFAVLAYWRCLGIPGNLPTVTGCDRELLLGEIALP